LLVSSRLSGCSTQPTNIQDFDHLALFSIMYIQLSGYAFNLDSILPTNHSALHL
jgi:hypothetical protein